VKYRHAHHAGNFADVHKHIALLAMLEALKRKEKGFLYLETHAGSGTYELTGEMAGESRRGIERFNTAGHESEELRQYSSAVAAFREARAKPHAYPGSPILAAAALRPQDRAVLVEIMASEARALEQAVAFQARSRVECDDGYARLRAHLPPAERRGLTFIDPPYEETRQEFKRVHAAIAEALQRFETGVIAAWYPIKQETDTASWHKALAASLSREALLTELWLYPRDSRVGLNGSGLLIVNPPYLFAERLRAWLPELHSSLDPEGAGGWSARALS
jgi:23S rRNA (adenine2030-N6)-methyltransferase